MKKILLLIVIASSLFSCCGSKKTPVVVNNINTAKTKKIEIKNIDLKQKFLNKLNPALVALIEKIDSMKPDVNNLIDCEGWKITSHSSPIIAWQEMAKTDWTRDNNIYDEETRANVNHGTIKIHIGRSYLRQIKKTDFFRFPYESPNSAQIGPEEQTHWFVYYGCLLENDTVKGALPKTTAIFPAGTLVVVWKDSQDSSLSKPEYFEKYSEFNAFIKEQIKYLPECIKPLDGYEFIGSSITY